ncbi:MAG: DNA-directed polymerase sigma-70 factor [Phycisphaerales bacterium]|nr:DNA-directed polymerase sigma-70 factor [Phycisphaerales bacterium]
MTTRASDMPLSLLTSTPRPADADSDAALVERLRKGDTRAAEALVRRYHSPLMGYLLRLGGQQSVAEELHQQTWLSVLQHVDRFSPSAGGSFKSWLFRIATNKANDLWRRRRREPAGDAALEFATAPAEDAAHDAVQSAEEAARLRTAIANLPEAQRQVLVMRYYGGLKFTEIAESLGCPLNTALGRMHKALIRLRGMLDDTGESRP